MTSQHYKWVLLVHQLPPKPSNFRVRIWRKLQQLGAISIKNSVYVLPLNEKTSEDFHWLKQEIESSGGEAAIFQADSVEGAMDEEIIAAFQQEREKDYIRLAAEFDGLTGMIRGQNRGGYLSTERAGRHLAELDKLHKELEAVIAVDFFDTPSRLSAMKAYESCQKAIHESQRPHRRPIKSSPSESGKLDAAQYQGKRWLTRKNLHIDRLAAVWLIKRFIDERSRFSFVAENASEGDGVRFDMYGAEFTHEGEDCTFEVLIRRFGLAKDAGLRSLAEIVHDIDLKDNKFNRTEAAGIDSILRGLGESLKDDRKLVQHTMPLFDGLYRLLGEKAAGGTRKANDEKRSPGRRPNRRKPSGRKKQK